MSTLQDEIQAHLGDDFRVERELGGGGMSRVFVARDTRLDRRVVVKLLRPELAAGVSVERFRREIRTAASLQHALIVPVLDVGELNGLPYFLMPFVDGQSLRMRLADGPMTVVDTVRILRDVARALAVAHAKGVVHRDIKPDNVLLSGDAAVVADFGVAKAFASARKDGDAEGHGVPITTIGVSLGTPAYMAPEQVAADPNAGAAMDIYAVGIMAFEMLTGAPPFTNRSPQAIMAAHIAEEPPALGVLRPGLPGALVALVTRCLEKDPARRPPSAAALVELLEDPTVLSGSFTPIPEEAAAAISGQQPLLSSALLALGSDTSGSGRTSSMDDLQTPSSGGTAAGDQEAVNGAMVRGYRLSVGAMGTMAAVVLLIAAVVWTSWPDSSGDGTNGAGRGAAVETPAAVDLSPSVAVLPFVYLGADTTQQFMAQAIADAITDGLARVTGLRVASRSRGEALQRRLIAGDTAGFPVQTVVEGVVEQEGDVVRLTVRLVNAADGFTLYADRIEGERSNLFALEDEIAAAMRERLAVHFGLPDSTTVSGVSRLRPSRGPRQSAAMTT